jgi:hypothetical protein
MKASLKGLSGINGLLLQHGEKLGMAIVVALSLFLVYKALQQPSLDVGHQPEKLDELIRSAKSDVEKASWDSAPADQIRKVTKLENAAAAKPIDDVAYLPEHWQIGPDPAIVRPTVLRTDPVLLAAQKLEANGGSGLLAFTSEEVRRQRALEEQQAAARKQQQQEKEAEKAQKEAEKGKSQRPGANSPERGGPLIDPEHPKRRLASGLAKPAGIATVGDEEVRPAYWAVVLAKVPIKDQCKLYRDALENARGYDPDSDSPRYLGYRVQRAEVRAGEQIKESDWKAVTVYNGKGKPIGSAVSLLTLYGRAADESAGIKAVPGVVDDWAAEAVEVVDPRYLDNDGVLAFPLPPLVGRDWGAEVSHSEIPLASKASAEPEPDAPQPDDKQATPAAPTEDLFSGGDASATGAGSRRRPPASMGRGGGGREMGRGEEYGGGRIQYRSSEAPQGGRGREYGPPARGGSRNTSSEMAPQVANWLLRFFDFSVEPGKKYVYRVQLVLQDPNDPNQHSETGNRLVNADALDKPVLDRLKAEKAVADKAGKQPKPIRMTAWSDPTPTVSIPLAGNVRVASAKPASDRFNDEPVATLLVESFGSDDKGKAVQAAQEEDFRRGSVANMVKDAEVLISGGQQALIDVQKNFPFRTGVTILDIDGGDPLTKDIKKPARVLLMDPAGQLFVQNEVDDADAVQLHRDIFAEPDKKSGRPGGTYAPGGRENPRVPGGFQQGFGR